MDKPITFSVIMPCYNSAAYVKNAIESIRNQTYPHWELIAVNDGSKDETPEILHAYAKEDNRIKVFEKENGGYATAVNLGLDHISGDYFLMLGSDDRLETSLFEKLCQQVDQIGFLPDCFAFRAIRFYNPNDFSVDSYTSFSSVVAAEKTTLKKFYESYPSEASIFFCRDTAKCFKRALLKDLRYFGWSGYDADGIFSMLLSHRATSFACFPVDGYFWTLRPDSVSASVSTLKNIDRIQNWQKFYSELALLPIEIIPSLEIEYLSIPYSILTELSKDLQTAKDQKTFIKENIRSLKKLSFRYKSNPIGFSSNIISFSPTLYARLRKFVSLFKK